MKITKNWLLVLKNSAGKSFLILGSKGKTGFGPRENITWATLF
jgi:hypothetical protein